MTLSNETLPGPGGPAVAKAPAGAPHTATNETSAGKRHYSAFSFMNMDDTATTMGSVYMGFPDRNITVPRIEEAKAMALMADNSVLLAVSYLGYMTRAEVAPDGVPPAVAPAPTNLTAKRPH